VKAGDVVVVEGSDRLTDGLAVQAQQAAAAGEAPAAGAPPAAPAATRAAGDPR
jgi:hypothetical protein